MAQIFLEIPSHIWEFKPYLAFSGRSSQFHTVLLRSTYNDENNNQVPLYVKVQIQAALTQFIIKGQQGKPMLFCK